MLISAVGQHRGGVVAWKKAVGEDHESRELMGDRSL